jgi:hypothetical protein
VATKQFPASPVVHLTMDPTDDDSEDWTIVTKPLYPTATPVAAKAETATDGAPRALRLRAANPRMKSYSECGAVLEKMASFPPSSSASLTRPRKARPYSTGDHTDLRRVSISGFSKNKNGTWMFTVDIGSDHGGDSYAVRRRFSDFRELYEGLEELVGATQLPELPHHGIYSVVQLFFSPEPALALRAKKLEELLQFVNAHPLLSMSVPFTKFLGKNPSSPDVGYVSLSCYEAPTSGGSFRLSSSSGRPRRQSS